MKPFDPSDVGLLNGNVFGLPCDYEHSGIIVLGVPWEVTVSYRQGTAQGPARILAASPQLDLYDFDNPEGWKAGIFMPPLEPWIEQLNRDLRPLAAAVIEAQEQGQPLTPELEGYLDQINAAGERVNAWLRAEATRALEADKLVATIGGDHSIPLGLMQALADRYPEFGILHIDAHADLRVAYEGFTYSHASIMNHALALPQIAKLIQVGIRDISHTEVKRIHSEGERVEVYYDAGIKEASYSGLCWSDLCRQIVEALPQNVYISFDVDGLDPKLCPNTGTPVPGGLELQQVYALIRRLVRSQRRIIGFDISETGNAEWDGNVAARALYKLCNLMSLSQTGIISDEMLAAFQSEGGRRCC